MKCVLVIQEAELFLCQEKYCVKKKKISSIFVVWSIWRMYVVRQIWTSSFINETKYKDHFAEIIVSFYWWDSARWRRIYISIERCAAFHTAKTSLQDMNNINTQTQKFRKFEVISNWNNIMSEWSNFKTK